LRAEFERLEHRHGAVHAVEAGDVAGGADDAALAAADDDGLVGEFGAVALFDTGVEGIAIQVGDGQGVQLGMAHDAAAAAGAARGTGDAG